MKFAVISATKGPHQAKAVEEDPRPGTTSGTSDREGRGEDFTFPFLGPTLAPTK